MKFLLNTQMCLYCCLSMLNVLSISGIGSTPHQLFLDMSCSVKSFFS